MARSRPAAARARRDRRRADGRGRRDDAGGLRGQPALRRAPRRAGLRARRRGLGRAGARRRRARWGRARAPGSPSRSPRACTPFVVAVVDKLELGPRRRARASPSSTTGCRPIVAKAGGREAMLRLRAGLRAAVRGPGGRLGDARALLARSASSPRRRGPTIAGQSSALGHDPRFREITKNRRWIVGRNCRAGRPNLMRMATYASRPAWELRARAVSGARVAAPLGIGVLLAVSVLLRTRAARRRLLDRRGPLGRDRRPAARRHPRRAAPGRLAAALLPAAEPVDARRGQLGGDASTGSRCCSPCSACRWPGGRAAAVRPPHRVDRRAARRGQPVPDPVRAGGADVRARRRCWGW